MKTFIALLALLGLTTDVLAVSDDYPKNTNIDALNYAYHISLSDETDDLVVTAVIDLRLKTSDIATIRLDLIGADLESETGMTVSGILVNGSPAAFSHEDDVLLIDLPDGIEAGSRVEISVDYSGTPATGMIIGPNKYNERTFFSDNWPNKARHWLVSIDHPYDKATCEFVVTAPSHYQVISNGLLIEETDINSTTRLTHWKQSVPIATWLFALGVARFAVQYVDTFDGLSIQTWVYHQDRDKGFYDFAVPTRHAMEFYSDMVGPFSYEKLANVQSNSVGGGMEAATSIFYGDNSVTGQRSERWRNVIIHEVAHQWFGNAVTEYDWDDVWLSEGFATYFTLLFIEHAYGRDAFVEGLLGSMLRVKTFYEANPDYVIVHDNLSDMSKVTSSQTYQKGSWILHMLRGVVGDDAFWAGIQSYYREYQDLSATTADFRRHMEEASGLDLQTFFDQWLYKAGHLRLEGSWTYDSDNKQVIVEIAQTQTDGSSFKMPVDVGVYSDDRLTPIVSTFSLDGSTGTWRIDVDAEPDTVELDPQTWLLADIEFNRR